VNAEQASKGRCVGPTRLPYRGRLKWLGELSECYAPLLHRGIGGGMYTRKAHETREALQIAVGKDDSINTQPSCAVGVVFGTECAGIRFVEAALLDARRAKDKLVDVEVKTYQTKKEMLDDAKRAPKRVIVVSSKTPWRPDWVVEAERIGRVRKGEVRLIFVGDPVQASGRKTEPFSTECFPRSRS